MSAVLTEEERVYRRTSGTWTDATNLLYIPHELAASLETLDLLDQRLNSSTQGGDRLGEHLEVIVRRVVPGASAPTSGNTYGGLSFTERHESTPSLGGSTVRAVDTGTPSVGAAPDTGVPSSPVSGGPRHCAHASACESSAPALMGAAQSGGRSLTVTSNDAVEAHPD